MAMARYLEDITTTTNCAMHVVNTAWVVSAKTFFAKGESSLTYSRVRELYREFHVYKRHVLIKPAAL